MPRTARQQVGDDAEALVAAHLAALGWTVLGRRVHAGRAEVDLVALDPGPPRRVVAVEVRWRSRRDWGLPEETFDRRKAWRVRAGLLRLVAAGVLPDGTPLPPAGASVDLVALEPSRAGPPRLRHHREVA